MERIGNVMIARAEDAISFRLEAYHDNTLRFRVDAENCRRTHIVLRSGPVTAATTSFGERFRSCSAQPTIDLATDVDRIGFSVCRAIDGQCIDMKESVLVKEISMRIKLRRRSAPPHP